MKLTAFFCCLLAFGVAQADEVLTEGELPVYSPDGSHLAFQRETAHGVRLGLFNLASRRIRWVDGAPGHAAQAAWHPSGDSLVYVFGHETLTAKEGLFAKNPTGWNLRLWKDGQVTPLTHGRFMDYTPSFSPDGAFVYFASTRVPVSPGRTSGTVLCRVPAAGGEPEQLTAYAGNSSGLCMPSVSTDGKRFVWAELESAFGAWHLAVARTSSPQRACRIGAADLVAYSPRWSPSGRLVCCTGYRSGDDGWSVYLMDPRTGSDRRLFPGREPAFSPDGRFLAYSRDGVIRVHALTEGDRPPAIQPPIARTIPAGKALVAVDRPKVGGSIPLPAASAFGDDKTFYIRFRGSAPQADVAVGAQCAFAGRYAESDLGFQIVFHSGGVCSFALRTATGEYCAVRSPQRVKWGTPVEVVGIRHDGNAYISVNGSAPHRLELSSTLALKTPRFIAICPPYHGVRPTCDIEKIEVGLGWPTDVARPCTIEEVFE